MLLNFSSFRHESRLRRRSVWYCAAVTNVTFIPIQQCDNSETLRPKHVGVMSVLLYVYETVHLVCYNKRI